MSPKPEIDKENGIFIYREVFNPDFCHEIAEALGIVAADMSTVIRDFDQPDLHARVIWSKTSERSMPGNGILTRVLERLEDATCGSLYLPEGLRSAQFNTQQPGAEQEFHADYPWRKSTVVHLSPDGCFSYITNNGSVVEKVIGIGDVVEQRKADKLMHRGSNPSTKVRNNLVLFFN